MSSINGLPNSLPQQPDNAIHQPEQSLFEEMRQMEISDVAYTALINSCIQARSPDRAYEVFEQMKNAGGAIGNIGNT